MKNMKKFLSLALTGAMMLGMLAGCGGDGETQVATADDSGTTTQTADSGSGGANQINLRAVTFEP